MSANQKSRRVEGRVTRYMVFLEGSEPPSITELQHLLEREFPAKRVTFLAEVDKEGVILDAYEHTVFRLGRRSL